MPDSIFLYRIKKDTSLFHAYASPYSQPANIRQLRLSSQPSNIRQLRKVRNGPYKSPYYDPVARHERYLRERSSLGIGKGLGTSSSSGRGGSGRGGSGKGSSQNNANLAQQVQALRNESSLNTEAQREAAKRKIEAFQEDLKAQIQKLRKEASDEIEKEDNRTIVRGITQNLKSQIENLQGKTAEEIKTVSKNLQDWISSERDSLERRIAALYKSYGKDYKVTTQADKQRASDSRDKEVSRRADSIYKKKS